MKRNTFEEIKRVVFAHKVGECRSTAEWQRLYEKGGKNLPLDHLTSCVDCLDKVNRLLDLPPLSERHPFDTIDRDAPPFDSGGGSSSAGHRDSSGSQESNSLMMRLEEARAEHLARRPEEITLCVNGWPLTSRRVQPGENSITVRPRLEEPLESLELIDEQGRLIYHLSVDAECAEGADGRWLNIGLGTKQQADIAVTWLDDCPEIYVEYRDERARSAAASAGLFSSLKQLLQSWRMTMQARELALAALVALVLISATAVIVMRESSYRQSLAALERESSASRAEREQLTRQLAEEQARRQAAEAERDQFKQRVTPNSSSEGPGKELIATAITARLRPGNNDLEAILLAQTRAQVEPITVVRGAQSRFALRLPRYDQDGVTKFESYQFAIKINGNAPIITRTRAPSASTDEIFTVIEAELANTAQLAPGTRGQVVVAGMAGARAITLGTIKLSFK